VISVAYRIPALNLVLLALTTGFFLGFSEVAAQDHRVQTFQDCRQGTPQSIVEAGPQVALNEFGPIDQTILGVLGTLGLCTPGFRVRWRLEGNYVHVDEGANSADAVKVGIGFTMRPIAELSGLTVTPIGRIGYEDYSGRSNRLYGGSITIEFVTPIRPGVQGSEPGVLLVLAERPEYISRSIIRSPVPVTSGSTATLSNFASAGLDGSFGTGSGWRWKAIIASTSIIEDIPTNQIFSGVVSVRPTRRRGSSYPWSVELWLSRGNGNYRGLLLSFTLRYD
jgi:hypothetical protein